jgi:hypothetical protein
MYQLSIRHAIQNKELRAELVKLAFLQHKVPTLQNITILFGSVVGTATAYGVGVRVPEE